MNDSLPILADLLARSAAPILFAWMAAGLLRKAGASAATRHVIWLLAIAGLSLSPLLTLTMPVLPLAVLPNAADSPSTIVPKAAQSVLALSNEDRAPSLIPTALLFLYLAVTCGLLARQFAGHRALGRIWRNAKSADHAWTQLLGEIERELNLQEPVELRFADDAVMPMTWGTLAPKIVLPAEARDWTPLRRRFVLLHELGHVRRRDSLTQTAAVVVRSLYWFQPGAWFAARQLQLEQELAADHIALAAGASSHKYARNLLELACAFCMPAPAMARRSQLERRLAAIVQPSRRSTSGLASGAIAASLVLATTWFSATAILIARPAAVSEPAVTLDRDTRIDPIPSSPAPAAVAVRAPAKPAVFPARAAPAPILPAAPRPAAALMIEAVATAQTDPSAQYEKAMANYRQERTEYETAIQTYRVRRAAYLIDLDRHRRDVAEYRRTVEAIRALPDGDPRKIFPPAPVAPVAPVAPPAPVVPPRPPNIDQS